MCSCRSSSAGVVLAAALALFWLPGEARATCSPTSPINNADIACTGATFNQNGSTGYGTSSDTGNTISVVPGASVGGTFDGIDFDSGTVFNSGNISGNTFEGIFANTNANITNSDRIFGGYYGIYANGTTNVTNSGTITGGAYDGIIAGTANVTNSGTISGGTDGINAATANVINSGTITGGTDSGIAANTANVTNSGSISSSVYGVIAFASANVTNSGTISGGMAALQFTSNSDTLTLLPSSTIIGAINLGGGGDTVNFRVGNQNLTFDTLASASVTSTVPYVVLGNRVVTVDPTPFAMSERNLMDFTGSVSAVLGQLFGAMDGEGSGQAVAFAPDSGADTRIADTFADIPGASAYAQAPALFANPTVHYADGTTVWGRGFTGERTQPQDGALIRTVDRFYGGMIGADRQVNANLRLGGFLGGGETRDSEDFNMGGDASNLVFGGLFGRYGWGASFLGLALQGGVSHTNSTRNINNNLMGGGIETATASYNGWYVSPQATYGRHYGLGSFSGATYTLTPSATLRYLYASFDGYTESGSTANMTVGTRSLSDLEERGELKLTRTAVVAPAQALITDIFVGVLGDERAGSSTVDATLLGQAIPFAAPGASDVWGGFAGAGLEFRAGRATLFASGEYLALSDSSSVIGGQGGVRVAF